MKQPFYYQNTGQYLTPAAMKDLLISKGISRGGTVVNQKTGPLPNVKNVILQWESGFSGKTKSMLPLEVKIYPNPSASYIAIQSRDDKKRDIEMINLQGRSVIKGSVSSDEKIDLSQLTTGQYIINITEGPRRVVEKFTKL